MSGFRTILDYFNSKQTKKIFTRAEYFSAMAHLKLKDSYLDTIRCYLQNAGYLHDMEPGVYRKMKKIPDNLTCAKLLDEAYGHDAKERRRKARNLRYSEVPRGIHPRQYYPGRRA